MTSEALRDEHALSRAEALVELRRWEEARTLLRHVVAEFPDSSHALCLLAQSELSLGSVRAGLCAADAAVAADPGNEWAHRLRSGALSTLRRRRKAVEAAEKAVALDPNHWAGHAQLAEAIGGFGARRALAAAHRAVELAPTLADAHFALGNVENRHGRRRRAIEAYHRTLALDPHHAGALDSLGRIEVDWNRLGRAAMAFGNVLAQDPRFGSAQQNLDLVLHVLLFRAWLALATGTAIVALVRTGIDPWGPGAALAAFTAALLVVGAVAALVVLPLGKASAGTRRYLVSGARRGAPAWAAWTNLLAAVCLPVAAVLPPHPAVVAFLVVGGALLVSLLAVAFEMARTGSLATPLVQGRSDHLRNVAAGLVIPGILIAIQYVVERR